jgi:NADPH:quinone reductase-like Zn-dependent oxidoreductase
MILGCDASGVDAEGRDVVVHAVIPSPDWSGDETLDPRRTLLSEKHQGTLAEQVVVPTRNVLPKPAELSHEEAACLSTAWLTAYRMLFVKSGARPGATVLVQGASGGVATALIALGSAAGYRMWVTGRTEVKRQAALALGADAAFEPGARLPKRVDAVMETVGEATWSHSLKSLAPGGTVVVCGATSGPNPPAALHRIWWKQLTIYGSTMGTKTDFEGVYELVMSGLAKPIVDAVFPLSEARAAHERMEAGDQLGKIVLTIPA